MGLRLKHNSKNRSFVLTLLYRDSYNRALYGLVFSMQITMVKVKIFQKLYIFLFIFFAKFSYRSIFLKNLTNEILESMIEASSNKAFEKFFNKMRLLEENKSQPPLFTCCLTDIRNFIKYAYLRFMSYIFISKYLKIVSKRLKFIISYKTI